MKQSERQRLFRTVQDQLESDLLLGGRWLPIGRLKTPKPITLDQPAAKSVEQSATRSQDDSVVKEKNQRLEVVADKIRKCSQCQLDKTRTSAVPGEGHGDARIVFVGEAPGADEDAQGRPFVGRAGKLLTSIIEAMGLKREDVFIGNILKCRPPGNRDPSAMEITACIDHLYEQLDVIEPEIIVALGAYAARTLLDTKDPIGRLRGRVHEYYPHPMARPIKLVATYHPAYLLRNYSVDSRRRVWDDMRMVLRELNLPVPKKKK